MVIERIVSFLPSATELIYELNAESMLKAVTHECTYPEEAKNKPKVINSVFNPETMSSEEIDQITTKLMQEGKNIFELDLKVLKDANPDLVIGQTTCEVCAAHTNLIDQAVVCLEKKPMVYSMDPHSIEEIIQSVIEISKIINTEEKGIALEKKLRKRINQLKEKTYSHRPKTLAIEWIKPFFTAGHWVPEMIEIAGGKNIISKTGEHSRRMSLEEIEKADPEIIIMMPCGFDAKRALKEYVDELENNESWNNLNAVKNNQVFFVDANSFFSKPSIRTITGIEILTKIIHSSESENLEIPENSFLYKK